MLQPKRVKYRKIQKGRIRKIAQRGYKLAVGTFGLKALEPCWISSRQLEAIRVAITRKTKREGIVHRRISPVKSITKKPAEVRMGSGKGSPEYFVAVVEPGRILYEIEGVSKALAEEAFRLADSKLGIKTKIVIRKDYVNPS